MELALQVCIAFVSPFTEASCSNTTLITSLLPYSSKVLDELLVEGESSWEQRHGAMLAGSVIAGWNAKGPTGSALDDPALSKRIAVAATSLVFFFGLRLQRHR